MNNLDLLNWIDEALTDLIIFRWQYKEALDNNLISDYEVWRRWLV